MNGATLVSEIVAGMDAQVAAQSANSAYVSQQGNSSWGGYFGPMADAIRTVWTQINTGTTMNTTVAYSGTYGTVTRTSGWSQALRASIDWGRFNRRGIANQAITCDGNIYRTNRGLLLVSPGQRAQRIRGAALPAGGRGHAGFPGQGPARRGPGTGAWEFSARAGLVYDHEQGNDKGRQRIRRARITEKWGPRSTSWASLAGDAALQSRGLQVTRSRDVFRFPRPG